MGNKNHKIYRINTDTHSKMNHELCEKEISLITHNTGFSREKVLEWHKTFVVTCVFSKGV